MSNKSFISFINSIFWASILFVIYYFSNATTALAKKKMTPAELAQTRMLVAAERVKVLSGNLANVDTPKYKSKDIYIKSKSQDDEDDLPDLSLAVSNYRHLKGGLTTAEEDEFEGEGIPRSNLEQLIEIQEDQKAKQNQKINGNNVSLIDQTQKISEAKLEYKAMLQVTNSFESLLSVVLIIWHQFMYFTEYLLLQFLLKHISQKFPIIQIIIKTLQKSRYLN